MSKYSIHKRNLKHFGFETLVIHETLQHIILNIFEYIFWHICTKIWKEKFLKYSQRLLNYFKWLIFTKDSQIVYIKSITQQKLILFLFFWSSTRKNSTIYWNATLLALILHVAFFPCFKFKCFAFSKSKITSRKSGKINNISIIFIKIIIKINIIKIYINNTHPITRAFVKSSIFSPACKIVKSF